MANQSTVIDIGFNLNSEQAYRDLNTTMRNLQQQASGASASISALPRGIGQASQATNALSSSVRDTSNIFNGFSNSITHSISKMGQWAIAGMSLYGTVHKLKEMGGVVASLDESMRQVRGVTGMTESQTDGLVSQYEKLAGQLNTTTTELGTLSVELARQGLGMEETARRMETVTKLAGVENLDKTAVLEYVTASVNAYKEVGLTAEKYADVTVKAAGMSATSVEEIAQGLQRSSAIARSSGVGFERLVSWISTVSETTRESASTIGNAMKGIMARFSKVNEYGEDNTVEFSKVRDAVVSMGVAFEDSSGQMRNVEDIMTDLAQIYPTLNKNQQNYLATQIGGAYHINKIITLFENWGRAVEIQDGIMNSAGETNRQYGEKTKAIVGSVDTVKQAFQELATNTINSQMIKSMLGLTTEFIKFIDKVGIGNIAIMALSVAISVLGKNMLVALAPMLAGFATWATRVAMVTSISGVATGVTYGFSTAITALSGAFSMLMASMAILLPALAVFAGIKLYQNYQEQVASIEAVAVAQRDFNQAMNEFQLSADIKDTSKIDAMTASLQKMKEELKISDEAGAVQSELDRLNNIISDHEKTIAGLGAGYEGLGRSLQSRLDELVAERDRILEVKGAEDSLAESKALLTAMNIEEQRSQLEVIANKAKEAQATLDQISLDGELASGNQQLINKYWEYVTVTDAKTGAVKLDIEALRERLEADVSSARTEFSLQQQRIEQNKAVTNAVINQTKARIQAMSQELQALQKLAGARASLYSFAGADAGLFPKTGDAYKNSPFKPYLDSGANKQSKDLQAKIQGEQKALVAQQKKYNDAQAQLDALSKVSMDDLLKAPKGGGGAPSTVKQPKGGGGGGKKTAEKKKEVVDIMEQFEEYIDTIEELDSALTILGHKERLAEGEETIAINEQIIQQHKAKQEALHKYAQAMDVEIENAKRALASNKLDAEQTNKLKDDLEKLTDTRRRLSETWFSEEAGIERAKDAIESYRKEQDKLAKEASDKVGKKATDAFKELGKAIDKQKKIASERWDVSINQAESELESFREKNRALDEQIKREKLLLDLQKAQLFLANTLKEKNVRLLTGNQFEWVVDPRELAKAQEGVNSAQQALQEHDLDVTRRAEEARIQTRIDSLKTQKENEMASYDERKEKLAEFEEAMTEAIKNGQEYNMEGLMSFLESTGLAEDESFKLRLEQLANFVAQWNAMMAQMQGAPMAGGKGDDDGLSGNWEPDPNNKVTVSSSGGNTTYTEHFSGGGSYSETVKSKAVGGYVSALDKIRVNEVGTEGFQWKENGQDFIRPLVDGKIVTANKMNSPVNQGEGGITINGNIMLPNVKTPSEFMQEMFRRQKTHIRNAVPV